MSFNRENVIWQSADGTWSRGFFTVDWIDYDGDPEWDVEYDFNNFEWVSTGHPTDEAAYQAWIGVNPGGSGVLGWTKDVAAECTRFDEMAAKCKTNGTYDSHDSAYWNRRW